jgi:MFS family permease
MMAHLHLTNDPSRVGFYSGLAESAFSICSLFSIYQWARLSGEPCHVVSRESYPTIFAKDVIGRRPVIFIGILGASFATLLFGLQRTLPGILLVRCIGQSFRVTRILHPSRSIVTGGFFSGNTAVIYSVLGEMTDSTNQAIAFPIFGLAWPVGSIIGYDT